MQSLSSFILLTKYSSNILRVELTTKEISNVTGLEPQILPYINIKEIKGSFPEGSLYKKLPYDEMLESIRKIVHHPLWEPSMDETFIMLGDSLTEDLSAQIALKLTVGNTAISKLEYNDEKKKWRIENWNDELHLG